MNSNWRVETFTAEFDVVVNQVMSAELCGKWSSYLADTAEITILNFETGGLLCSTTKFQKLKPALR